MLSTATATYQRESLSGSLWDEIEPLLQAHYHEIAHWRDIALEPDHEAYTRLEANGGLRIYTARVGAPAADRGRLIGYLCCIVSRSLHYRSHLFATQDVLYVDKSHRGSRVGVDLIRYAHGELRIEGVSALMQHVKHREDINIGPMLVRLLGYERVDDLYAIRLDRE